MRRIGGAGFASAAFTSLTKSDRVAGNLERLGSQPQANDGNERQNDVDRKSIHEGRII
jgi:hypothetical protein